MLGYSHIKLLMVLSSCVYLILMQKQNVSDLKFKDNPQQFTFRYDRIVGDSVKLNCELNLTNSVPWLSISWMKNGQPLEDVSYRVQNLGSEYTKGWILSMESLLLADNGQYSCKIGNGSVSLERTFNLYIKEKNHLKKPHTQILKLGNVTAEIGSKVTFECEAYGSSLPYIEWIKHVKYVLYSNKSEEYSKNYTKECGTRTVKSIDLMRKNLKGKNDTMYKKGNSTDMIEIKKIERGYKSILIIDSVDLSDDAEYKCIAFNDVGYSIASGCLRVLPAPTPSKLDLALSYEKQYGDSGGSSIVVPLSLIIVVPVCSFVFIVIAFIWYIEHNNRKIESDKLSLIPLITMRHEELFNSEEHLPSHYPKIHFKRLSELRRGKSMASTEEEERHSSELPSSPHQQSHHSLSTSRQSIPAQSTPHAGSIDDDTARPEADQHSTHESEIDHRSLHESEDELEWEPQEFELKISVRDLHSNHSNTSL